MWLNTKAGSHYRVTHLCGLFGVTKQAFYKRNDENCHRRMVEERPALEYAREVRGKDPGIGGRKLYHMYSRDLGGSGHIGRDAFETLMAESGNPKDNAQAERISSTIKNELLKDMSFGNIREVRDAVESAVRFYNNERPHMSINMLTPVEASTMSGEIPRRWRSYRAEAVKNKSHALGYS